MSEQEEFANSVKTITEVVALRFAADVFNKRLSEDATLASHFILNLLRRLRLAERHSMLLACRPAVPKLAGFLQMIEQLQSAKAKQPAEIYLPMTRSEISAYLGISLEAVSRAFRTLSERGIVKTRVRHHLKILDRRALKRMSVHQGPVGGSGAAVIARAG
jgi:CRP/FNR family transcriptional regulator